MITPAYLRERAAFYLKLAETVEMRAHADTLRTLAQAFECEAKALEERGSAWKSPGTVSTQQTTEEIEDELDKMRPRPKS